MNKPVAWIGETLMGRQYINGQKEELPVGTPLYTNLVKELTDEEILEVWRENERVYPMDRSRLLDSTRACIKKASEK